MTAAERRRAVEEAEELLAEDLRLHLTLEEEVGLALRAVRGAQGMSQRVYAEAHDWSASQQARVETRAGGLRFGHVLAMLAPIEVTLCVLGDLGRVRSKKVTADVMGGTSADPGRGVDGQVVPLATPADLSAWIIARSRELGVGTRVVADLADTSQTMVCRGRSGTRIENVRLDVLERIVGALDGSMRIAWDDSGAPELIEPWDWPTAALVPRARGGERRLAAHGRIRRSAYGPAWWSDKFSTQVREWGQRPRWTGEDDGWGPRPAKSPIAPIRPPALLLGSFSEEV